MTERLMGLRQAMITQNLDAMLVTNAENRAYMSGFTGSAGWLLITPGQAYLITDFRYVEQAAKQAPHFEVVRHTGKQIATLQEKLVASGCQHLGFERDAVTYTAFEELTAGLAGVQLIGVSGLVGQLREIKDEQEKAIMQQATEIAEHGFLHILNLIKPGVSERDIALELEYHMRKLGADGVAFDTIVASGPRSSLPHGLAGERLIQKGDLITMDFGAHFQGYCSDMTRTMVVGQPSQQQREVYQIVLDAHSQALAAVRPGLKGKEVDAIARQVITAKGYGEYFGHGLGHGVGRVVHEGPSCGMAGETELVPGHVITIEPGIYLPNWGGVRIEDMVMVTADGYHDFNRTSKELIIL